MSTWGWTPESFAAVGTVGALAATAEVLVREAFARIRAQAERVVVWIDRRGFHDGESRTEGCFCTSGTIPRFRSSISMWNTLEARLRIPLSPRERRSNKVLT